MKEQALEYVKNTNGGATVVNFIEDHEPIGRILWAELVAAGLVREINGRIFLTQDSASGETK